MSANFFQPLEPRKLMAASLVDGVLTVTGTANNDVIAVSQDSKYVRVNENGSARKFLLDAVQSVVVNGLGGADQLLGRTNLTRRLTLRGGDGNDSLVGGARGDTFEGGAGIDTADFSHRTDNLLISLDDVANDGGASEADNVKSDVENLKTGRGNDVIKGSHRANTIDAGAGDDNVAGESGNDTLRGGEGKDSLSGGAGNDHIDGGNGNDTMWGNINPLAAILKLRLNEFGKKKGGFTLPIRDQLLLNPILTFSTDHDVIYGGNGNDTAYGGPDNDTLSGDADRDSLHGGDGNDLVRGGTGDDLLNGDAGNDTIWGESNPLPRGTAIGAVGRITRIGDIVLNPTFLTTDNDVIAGGTGNDALYGNSGDDRMAGDTGHDTLYGGAGNDHLDGGAHNDALYGEADRDTLVGGAGWDLHDGGAKVDVIPSTDGDVVRVGSFEVYGAIGQRWVALGGESSFLGNPLTNESATPDGVGRYNHFAGGSIYWTPATGPQVIYGAIRDLWANLGWERGGLGYPTSDELPAGDGVGRLSRFQNGEIYWSPGTGAYVRTIRMPVPTDQPQYDDWSCGPNSVSRVLRYYGINVSYSTARSVQLRDTDLVSRFKMGSRPSTLLSTFRRWRPDAQRESRTSFDRVLQLLGEGKPVVALLGWGRDYTFGLGAVPSTLHWAALTGFDKSSSTIYYTDTNGQQKQFSYAEFQQKWNWYSSGGKGGFLTGTLDVPERTILY